MYYSGGIRAHVCTFNNTSCEVGLPQYIDMSWYRHGMSWQPSHIDMF